MHWTVLQLYKTGLLVFEETGLCSCQDGVQQRNSSYSPPQVRMSAVGEPQHLSVCTAQSHAAMNLCGQIHILTAAVVQGLQL